MVSQPISAHSETTRPKLLKFLPEMEYHKKNKQKMFLQKVDLLASGKKVNLKTGRFDNTD